MIIIIIVLSICITLGIAFLKGWFTGEHIIKLVFLFCAVLLALILLSLVLGQVWSGFNGTLHRNLG